MGVPAYINVASQHPDRTVPFWCDLLDVRVATPRDEGRYVVLEPSSRLPGSMMLVFQRVPEPKVGKNRVHVDVIVDDLEEGTKKVEALVGRGPQPGTTLAITGFGWQ